ncbi:MFS transporter [Desulfonatronum sp. SC1]|uniref:MFS transporter n=1 Tax=Desulfonatronum sp. SC1 TaxID=2109626 RepID=UPI000D318E9A|nr:MFS transporter [Desulfonatronum sp. SC1]PTN39057.1 hypothetical protein C6366_01070 [Desulfonatronum sp. SC1]
MKPNLSLRVNVFLVAVLVIILGQAVYSFYNLQSFKTRYVQALRDKAHSAALFLKQDIEQILALGIPLPRIARLEQTLARTLEDVPEAAFIEVVGPDLDVLFFADPDQAAQVSQPPGNPTGPQSSRLQREEHLAGLARMGLSPEDTDISLPLLQRGEVQGYLRIHVAGAEIRAKSRLILWDMLTVMLTSLLLTFEFLTFFVVYYISHPLMLLRRDIAVGFGGLEPVETRRYADLGRIAVLADHFNAILAACSAGSRSALLQVRKLAGIRGKVDQAVQSQERRIDDMRRGLMKTPGNAGQATRHGVAPGIASGTALGAEPWAGPDATLGSALNALHQRLEALRGKLGGMFGPVDPTILTKSSESVSAIPPALIRPLIFLFLMADGFSLSFFPMYVDSMYQPLFGLSREMVISLPLSVFMLVMAVSLPLSGGLTDSVGWRRPLLAGLVLNAAGHALTAMAQDILMLVLFRSLAAVGFGMVFMCCQRFVVDTTDQRSRAMGMAGFLAAMFSGDICGTVIGAMLAERIGYAAVFSVSALFSGLALLFALAVFRGSFRPVEPRVSLQLRLPFKKEYLVTVFRDRDFRNLVLLQAIPAKLILVGFLFFFTPLYLNSLDAMQSTIGRVVMCYSVCLIFIGPLFTWIFPQERLRPHFVAAGGLITGAALLLFLVADGLFAVLAMVVLLGVAQSLSISAQASLVADTAVVREMGPGAAMGVFRFWERTGNVAGPLVMAFLVAKLGYTDSVLVLGALSLACSVIYLFAIASRPKHSASVVSAQTDDRPTRT